MFKFFKMHFPPQPLQPVFIPSDGETIRSTQNSVSPTRFCWTHAVTPFALACVQRSVSPLDNELASLGLCRLSGDVSARSEPFAPSPGTAKPPDSFLQTRPDGLARALRCQTRDLLAPAVLPENAPTERTVNGRSRRRRLLMTSTYVTKQLWEKIILGPGDHHAE